jgi:DNA-binding transcriptional LysR family regulator
MMKYTDQTGGLFSDIGNPASLMHWDDARVFLAIARSGTISGAAVQLGTGLATISRRIERLEQALGLPLFSRHQNGYRLTDDGEALMGRAEALEQAGHAFCAGGKEQQVAGRVRLATAETLANVLVIPSLPTLMEQHPGLGVDIVTDVHTVNLHRRDADIALRMVKPHRGNVTMRRIGMLGYGLYGAASYINGRAEVEDAANFDGDRFIGWAETQSHLPAAEWVERTRRGRFCAITTTTLAAQLSSVKAGLGLAVLPHLLARHAGLVCLRSELGVDQPIWLVIHSDLTLSRRVRVVADHLTDLIHTHRSFLRGE